MNIERKNPGQKNNKETCPACGKRKRYPEHPLCPDCNAAFINDSAEALVDGRKVVDRIKFAEQKGKETLLIFEQELALAVRKEKDKQQPFWDKAHREIKARLREQGSVRVDNRTYRTAVGKQFGIFWNEEPGNQKLSRKVYGLQMAIRSLGNLLQSFETKQAENVKSVSA